MNLEEHRQILTQMEEHVLESCQRRLPDLTGEQARHLYWIAREAVINARQHGRADRIEVQLDHAAGESLQLTVIDDGTGFSPADESSTGMGLRSMLHRMELIGGHLTIESAPGEGTAVTCTVPLSNRDSQVL